MIIYYGAQLIIAMPDEEEEKSIVNTYKQKDKDF